MANKKEEKSKNPIVHLLKDPVKTTEEADERKKKLLIVTITAFVLGAICSAIAALTTGVIQFVVTVPALVLMLAGIFGVILLIALKKMKQKFADLDCPNCHTRIEYSKDVEVEELKRELRISTKANSPASSVSSGSITMDGNEYVTVKIRCKCQKCGTEKEFTHTFRSATVTRTEKASTAQVAAVVKAQMENDLRQFQNAGFSGDPHGFRVVKVYSMNELVQGYFGDVIQVG